MLENIHTQTKTLREQAYQKIKDSILRNFYLPGEAISINLLAAELGISQTPVREALGRLRHEGLIEYEPHKKPRVATITQEDVRQVYEVRKLLEPCAANLVASSIADGSDIKKTLQKLFEDASDISQTPVGEIEIESCWAIDLGLHEVFLAAAGDTLFREVLAFVGHRSLRIRTFAEAVTRNAHDMLHEINAEHLRIIEMLLRGDSVGTLNALSEHLTNGETRTLEATGSLMMA